MALALELRAGLRDALARVTRTRDTLALLSRSPARAMTVRDFKTLRPRTRGLGAGSENAESVSARSLWILLT